MSSKSQTPSKGPPPLPTHGLPDAPFNAPLGDVAEVEEAFFLEGIDGRADSLPSESEAATIMLAPIGAQRIELETDAELPGGEDPARARRRRAARIGVVWGAALMVGVAGASAFMGPHAHDRSTIALSTSASSVEKVAREKVASSPAATVIAATPPAQVSPETQPDAADTPARSTVHAMTASAKPVAATHPRAAGPKKGAAASHGAKPSPASPKVASTRRVARAKAAPANKGPAQKRIAGTA